MVAETVDELRAKLVSLGMTAEEANSIKGKGALKDMIENLEDLQNANVEETEILETGTPPGLTEVIETKPPSYDSPEWESYVMAKFQANELAEGKHPKLPGLRRVANLLLGDVVFSSPTKVDTVLLPDAPGRCSVVYTIRIMWKFGMHLPYNDIREFSALGGSWHGNTDDMFAVFPEAIAEARAEARAYRKALQLSVVGADELTRKDTAEITRSVVEKAVIPSTEQPKKITNNQINSIKNISARLGIDVTKFINMGSKKYDVIEDVSYEVATKMISQLSRYQSNGEDFQEIPASIKVESK
jgi:hypothetical protein